MYFSIRLFFLLEIVLLLCIVATKRKGEFQGRDRSKEISSVFRRLFEEFILAVKDIVQVGGSPSVIVALAAHDMPKFICP